MKVNLERLGLLGGVLFLVGGAALVTWIFWSKYQNKFFVEPTQYSEEFQDLSVLKDEKAPFEKRAAALSRLARFNHKEAFKVVLEWAESATFQKREAAATVIGFYDNEASKKALLDLLNDENAIIRRRALRSVPLVKNTDREAMLRSWLESPELAPIERVDGFSALANTSDNKNVKANVQGWLLDFAQKGKGPEHAHALMLSIGINPTDQRVLKYLRSQIPNGRSDQALVQAIQILSGKKDPILKPHLAKFLEHKVPQVRAAGLQAALFYCPKEVQELLTHAASQEKDMAVIGVLLESGYHLGGTKGRKVIEAVQKKNNLSDPLKARAAQLLKDVTKSRNRMCS